ncbi:40S ribosomal protein S27 [Xenoophorus captivus]|uniref:40S ribosomal protein S27 n=1 Tax=Xenoophorus captivus TaxID=1517983 RepID=A0ABV0RWJ3_9TELE
MADMSLKCRHLRPVLRRTTNMNPSLPVMPPFRQRLFPRQHAKHLERLAKDLLHPSPEEEKRRHKKKRLVQSPNSYFMDVKCPGCYKITTVFSHAQTVVLCVGCSTVLCQPTGGKARLTEGCSFRRKQH